MLDKLAKLIDVKTIVTFGIVGVFSYLAIVGTIPPTDVKEITLLILTFFFAKNKVDETKPL